MQTCYSLITGTSEGIGRIFATKLAERGDNLVIVARNRARLESLATELTSTFDISVGIVVGDMTKADAAQTIFDACSKVTVNKIINNTGFEVPLGPFQSNRMEEVNAMIQLNDSAQHCGFDSADASFSAAAHRQSRRHH